MKYLKKFKESINEDGGDCFSGGVAYSNASNTSGMGSISSAQPSILAGSTINPSLGGGSIGSGDISVPYNAGNGSKSFQKIPASMGRSHGPNTGKKSRVKRQDIKNIFAKKQDFTSGQIKQDRKKVMKFDDFNKEKINQVTHVKN